MEEQDGITNEDASSGLVCAEILAKVLFIASASPSATPSASSALICDFSKNGVLTQIFV
jgi:hypothetical protein